MQDFFLDGMLGKTTLVQHVLHAVEAAKKAKQQILLVEYVVQETAPPVGVSWEVWSTTTAAVQRVLQSYDQVKHVKKPEDNGGHVLDAWFCQHMPSITTVQVCGINLDACVAATAQGLAEKNYTVQLLRKAVCNTWEGYMPIREDFGACLGDPLGPNIYVRETYHAQQ